MIDLRLSVQKSQHHLFPEDRRDHARSHIQPDPFDRLPEMSVLRNSLFCDIHPADDLRSRHERLVHGFVKLPDHRHHSIDPHPDHKPVLPRFHVNIAGIFPVSEDQKFFQDLHRRFCLSSNPFRFFRTLFPVSISSVST